MTTFFASRLRLLALPLFLTATGVQAQSSPTPAPTPTLIPGLENFRLPGDRGPAPRPTPTPTQRTAPPPVARTVPPPRPAARPTPRATPTPRAAPTPRVIATPRAITPPVAAAPPPRVEAPVTAPTPVIRAAPQLAPPPATPAPEAVPVATPTPIVTSSPVATVDAEPSAGNARWLIIGGIAVVLIAGLGWAGLFFLRRRNIPEDREIEIGVSADDNGELAHAFPPTAAPEPQPQRQPQPQPQPQPEPMPEPEPEPVQPAVRPPAPAPPPEPVPLPEAPRSPSFLKPAPVTAGPRAQIELALRTRRAGTNLTSAAVDYEIGVRNTGNAAARGIRLDIRLLSASAEQDAVLTALFAAPIDKPPVAPFDLEPGADVSLGGMAMMPKEALSILTVQDKAFFVPVMSVNALYHWEPGEAHGGNGQTATAFVIGIDRGEDAKMGPFRADTGPRMFDGVSQRPHSLTIER